MNAQLKTKPVIKLFFEEGFKNCKVKVFENKKLLFTGNLTTPINGAAKILEINKISCLKVSISACGKTKVISIKNMETSFPQDFRAIFFQFFVFVIQLNNFYV